MTERWFGFNAASGLAALLTTITGAAAGRNLAGPAPRARCRSRYFMTHLSIAGAAPGDEQPEAGWGEHVTDDEYPSS